MNKRNSRSRKRAPLSVPPVMLKLTFVLTSLIEKIIPVPDMYTSESLRVQAGVTYLGDDGKARRELGYNPRSLEAGLKETFVFYYIMKSIKAYFDGNTIRLEESVELQINEKLLVIRLQESGDNVDRDKYDILLVKDTENRLYRDSIVKTTQISSFDKKRFFHYIGRVNNEVIAKIQKYISYHFNL